MQEASTLVELSALFPDGMPILSEIPLSTAWRCCYQHELSVHPLHKPPAEPQTYLLVDPYIYLWSATHRHSNRRHQTHPLCLPHQAVLKA